MASIFIGQSGLRLKFNKLTFTAVAAANSAASSVMLSSLNGCSRIAYFDNSLNVECAILAVHPDADAAVSANRLLLFELPVGRFLNLESNMIEFDPGTKLFVYCLGGLAPTSGAVRLVWWG